MPYLSLSRDPINGWRKKHSFRELTFEVSTTCKMSIERFHLRD